MLLFPGVVVQGNRSKSKAHKNPEGRNDPHIMSKDLQASLALANVSVHASTIRKTLNKKGVHGRTARRKPLLSKKNTSAPLKLANDHLEDPEGNCKNVLWTDESKVELFGINEKRCVCQKPNTAFQQKNLIPTMKHGVGSIMFCGCFAASGPG